MVARMLKTKGVYEYCKCMAEKCIWAIENYEKAKEMGANARKFAEENFDHEKINDYILSVIEDTKTNE